MPKQKYNIVIVGATGVVGEAILSILAERDFPIDNLYALASNSSDGHTVLFNHKQIEVRALADFDFSKADIAIFSAGSSVSKEFVPQAAASGCVVIDNTSQFRNDELVPLVIPEINPETIHGFKNKNIIANPNCSTIQMLLALYSIYRKVGLKSINVTTFQSVSGSGKAAISELITQTTELLNGRPATKNVYPKQIAFNVLPHIDKFDDSGFTCEELKMIRETHKIFGDPSIEINSTTVRVPVLYGHSEAITIETKQDLTADNARQLLLDTEGVTVLDNIQEELYPTPFEDAIGSDQVYVGRIRNSLTNDRILNLWVVSDNIRKGAALNSVQIAELLVSRYL